MATSGVDISKFRGKVTAIRKAMPPAMVAGLTEVMDAAMVKIMDGSPRDTNRMVRGFAMAANMAKLGPYAVPTVTASKYFPQNLRDLRNQLRRLYRFRSFLVRFGAKTGSALRTIDKDIERATAALQQVDATAILVINKGRGVELTVRTKLYGGSGARTIEGDKLNFTIVNHEPHALIRERTARLVASALATIKASGGRRVRTIMLRKIELAMAKFGRK